MRPNPDWPAVLLAWFDGNRRDLPWREAKPRNPYHVWISEIMLQQTRTEAVKPYFNAWMERFPKISDVAEAPEETVLHAWQGLGYYSRARNIRKAAQEITASYGGHMPEDLAEIRALPGIGDYTAGAVASIAYGKAVPAVDGNVLRVFARLYAVKEDILKSKGRKEITALAAAVIPQDRPGDFNEALMDLGAEVCIPRHSRCGACPLAAECEAFAQGIAEELPIRTKKKPQTVQYGACALLCREGRYLMHKRAPKGMLANMWEFPMVLSGTEEESRKGLEELLGGKTGNKRWELTHVFTHRIWHLRAYDMEEGCAPEGADCRWFTPEEMRHIPLAGPHARLAGIL